jgi:hypothetical protein
VLCSCVVIRHVHPPLVDRPSRAVHPCAPDTAPLRYPTRTRRKHCASGLLGPRGAVGVSVGRVTAAGQWHERPGRALSFSYIGASNQPQVGGPIRKP